MSSYLTLADNLSSALWDMGKYYTFGFDCSGRWCVYLYMTPSKAPQLVKQGLTLRQLCSFLSGFTIPMTKPLELYAASSPDRSVCVVAIQSPSHGFCISRQQLLQAKRKLKIPDWATVFLRPNGVVKQLAIVSFKSDDCEVITCVS